MNSIEAKEYFSTLGSLHKAVRVNSEEAGKEFLATERQTPEYSSALLVLKLSKEHHLGEGVGIESGILRQEVQAEYNASILYQLRGLPDSKLNRWRLVRKKYDQGIEFVQALEQIGPRVIAQMATDERFLHDTLLFGARLFMFDVTQEQRDFVRINGFGDRAIGTTDLMHYANSPSLTIKVGDVTLYDFAHEEFRGAKGSDPAKIKSYLELVMSLTTVGQSKSDEEEVHSQNNENPIHRKYPFLARNSVIEAGELASSLYLLNTLPYVVLDTFRRESIPFYREVANDIDNLTANFRRFKDQVGAILFNPSADGFEEVMQIYQRYLRHENKFVVQYALTLANIYNVPTLISAYRKAARLTEESPHRVFYTQVATEILDIFEYSNYLGVPLIEDVESVVNRDSEVTGEVGGIVNDLRTTIDSLRRIPSWRDFRPEELDIEWDDVGIKKPNSIKLDFSKGTPHTFTVTFEYQNELGESLTLHIDIDSIKGTLDWSVPQSADGYPDLQKRFLAAAKSVLTEVHEQARIRYQSVQTPIAIQTIPRIRRERPDPSSRPVKMKPPTKELLTPIKLAQAEDIVEFKIKNSVEIPEPNIYEEFLRGIPNDQKDFIQRRIDEVNLGRRRPKRLEHPGPNGERQYRLRAGDYRVLLLEKEFSQGVRTYTIRIIGHRNNIYDEVDE